MERIERGEIDPAAIITHRLPLSEAAHGYKIFRDKQESASKSCSIPQHRAYRNEKTTRDEEREAYPTVMPPFLVSLSFHNHR